MRDLKIIYMSVSLLLLTFTAVSQRIIVNSKGERIIMYPDGSWRLAEPRDSLLVRQYLQGSGTMKSKTENEEGGRERNKGEEQEHVFRQWVALYDKILLEEKRVQDDFRKATNAQFKAGEQLRNAEANKKLLEPHHLATLNETFERSVLNLRMAKMRQKNIKAIVEKAKKLNGKISKINARKFTQVRSRYNLYLAQYDQAIKTPFESPPKRPSSPGKDPKPEMPKSNTPPPAPAAVRTLTTPSRVDGLPAHRKPKPYASKPFKCVFTRDTFDTASGRRRIELEPTLIFTFTDPDLKPYFKDKDLIICRGGLSKIGPYIYLTMDFEIASSHSQSNFGSLQNGSLLRFKLLNGEYISLYNLKSDRGKIDSYSGHTLFSGQYALGKQEIKKLRDASLDKMRVLWETGFEDYEVYHIDFLSHQINCLMNKK